MVIARIILCIYVIKNINYFIFYLKVPVIFGILLNSFFDLKYNFYGLNLGLIGALISSVYQVVSKL